MSWHQLVIELGGTDAGAADHAVLEPAPGETPLWPEVCLRALYPDESEPRLVAATLATILGLAPERIAIHQVADRVWEREWLRDFRPMRFGRRLWVCPGGQRPDDRDAIVLELDPGLAFGTGAHATTALCLEWLEGRTIGQGRVLDYGCGSGILAVATLRLGAGTATAFDIDPQALLATRENAGRNGLAGRLEVVETADALRGPFDVLLANILAGPLAELAPSFARLCRPGAEALLAGLLDSQAANVAEAYRPWFDIETAASREGWTALACRRRAE